MSIRIGLPRALLYYEFSSLWTKFFEELGAEIVISPKTNKKILNSGTATTVEDACIPVKVYHGHVIDLKDKVNYLFVPRIMGIKSKEYICPKFCGLPEMVKHSVHELPEIINTSIHINKKNDLKKSMYDIGNYITKDKQKIEKAYDHAYQAYLKQKKCIENLEMHHNIMIMGHPYLLYDEFLNMNIKKKLEKSGYHCITPDMLDEEVTNEYAKKYHGKIFWLFFRQMMGACLYLLEHQKIDGVIYLSSFGCGIDSVVAETVERNMRRYSNIPFMLITIDEHSGEAGFNTRIEAFLDMLKWREQDENYLSTYGNDLYSH